MSMGLRTFSGLTIGVLGVSVCIHNSMVLSAGGLLVVRTALFFSLNIRTARSG
jgi:hypothetical protein